MQSDARSDMGISKLVESFSIDLMERGRLSWIRQVVVWGGGYFCLWHRYRNMYLLITICY
jgi:hypothetical protein